MKLLSPNNCLFTLHVHIRSYSGPYFPAFRLNTEKYSVSLCIQFAFEKIRTRITPNTETFYTVTVYLKAELISNTSVGVTSKHKYTATYEHKDIYYTHKIHRYTKLLT